MGVLLWLLLLLRFRVNICAHSHGDLFELLNLASNVLLGFESLAQVGDTLSDLLLGFLRYHLVRQIIVLCCQDETLRLVSSLRFFLYPIILFCKLGGEEGNKVHLLFVLFLLFLCLF